MTSSEAANPGVRATVNDARSGSPARPRSTTADMRAKLAETRRALRLVEWSGPRAGIRLTCPRCRAPKKGGHYISCEIGKALAAPEKESTDA